MKNFGFNAKECKILSRLNSPKKIQDFLDKIEYNFDKEDILSPRRVLREKKACCIEGALFAAAALRFHGHKPLIVDLISSNIDDDHEIVVFKKNGYWGAIAKSRYPSLTYREPIHKTLRELALSYFEDYFLKGVKTMRGYSTPVNLSRFDKKKWMTTEKSLSFIEEYLFKIKHKKLLTRTMIRNLRKVDPLLEETDKYIIKKSLKKH